MYEICTEVRTVGISGPASQSIEIADDCLNYKQFHLHMSYPYTEAVPGKAMNVPIRNIWYIYTQINRRMSSKTYRIDILLIQQLHHILLIK